jgi:hypothetical protein
MTCYLAPAAAEVLCRSKLQSLLVAVASRSDGGNLTAVSPPPGLSRAGRLPFNKKSALH